VVAFLTYTTAAEPAKQTKPPAEPKKRSALALLAAGIAALLVLVAGGAWWFLGANRPATIASNAAAPALKPRAAGEDGRKRSLASC
jgi:hypothetical protein